MIPKIIHYCWFGPKKIPNSLNKNIEEWHKLCPDFEFKFWNEDNFDFSQWNYGQEAYDSNHWGFVSDIARLYLLYVYGGFYLDTDVKLYKNLLGLCRYRGFAVIDSTNNRNWCHTAMMGAVPKNTYIFELLDDYENRIFDYRNGYFNLKDNIQYLTQKCNEYGFKNKDEFFDMGNFQLLPSDYCLQRNSYKNRLFTENTYAYHESTSLCYTSKELNTMRPTTIYNVYLKIKNVIKNR